MFTLPQYMSKLMWVRIGSIAVLLLGICLFGRSSSAEFEVPITDVTPTVKAVQFHGVWAYHRGTATIDRVEGYEAYAVGVNADVASCTNTRTSETTDATNCNGVFYVYDGKTWKNVPNIFYTPTTTQAADLASAGNPDYGNVPFSLNAVVGKGGGAEGNPDPMVVVGSDARIGILQHYYTTLGKTVSQASVSYPAQFKKSLLDYTYTVPAAYVSGTIPDTRDFYTVDVPAEYISNYMAGGQNGLVAIVGVTNNANVHWNVVRPKVATTVNGTPDTDIPFTENITRIRFYGTKTAYILTTTLPGTTSIYDRDCTGNQTTKLYKTTDSAADDYLKKWNLLQVFTNTCGYDMAYGTPASTATTGVLPVTLWIASNKGVLKYSEDPSQVNTTTSLEGTSGKPMYAITALPDRGGSGVDLLKNGSFRNTIDGRADGWIYFGDHVGRDRWCDSVATCTVSGTAYPIPPTCFAPSDYSYVNPSDPTQGIVVWQRPATSNGLPSGVACVNRDRYGNFMTNPYYTSGIAQNINGTTFEGQKFHITGDVTVEFPKIPAGDVSAPAPQGGVAIGCEGSFNNNPVSGNKSAYINCSLSNRSYIVTNPAITAGSATDAPPPVTKHIDLTISREDAILQYLNNPGKSESRNYGTITKGLMNISIRCEATYGAKVTCSNLRVEEVNDPPIPGRDHYVVISGGPNIATNPTLINSDALQQNKFTPETIPSTVVVDYNGNQADSVMAMYGLGLQHLYAAGQGVFTDTAHGIVKQNSVFLLNRTPSTLKGSLWNGAASPTDATTTSALGAVSISCVDDRDSSGTTLCARSPDSYGLSMETIRTQLQVSASPVTNVTITSGALSGRAWYGHALTQSANASTNPVSNDREVLDLGSCLRKPGQVFNANTPFWLGAGCYSVSATSQTYCAKTPAHVNNNIVSNPDDLTSVQCNSTADCGMCDLSSRTCWTDVNKTAHSTVSCTTDFDCYGRCQRDEGFLCTSDEDCKVQTNSFNRGTGAATAGFSAAPVNSLVCNSYANSTLGSPIACSSIGWLSFSATDFTDSVTPSGSTVGGLYNTLFTPDPSTGEVQNRNFAQPGAHELSGWGRFVSLASSSDSGWVRLRGDAVAVAPAKLNGIDSLFACRNCGGSYNGGTLTCSFCTDAKNHSCVPPNAPVTGVSSATSQCYNVCEGSNATNGLTPGVWKQCTPGNNADCAAAGGTGVCKTPGVCSTTVFCTGTGQSTCATGKVCMGGVCTQSPQVTCSDTNPCSNGGACVCPNGGTGCTQKYCQAPSVCTSSADCGGGTCQNFGSICKANGARCAQYGVNLDTDSSQFYGNAWSDDFGWTNFSEASTAGNPSLQTRLGDIYSSGSIGSQNSTVSYGLQNCTATYVITSTSTITNFCSYTNQLNPYSSTIPLVSPQNSYSNVLGRLDIKGIESAASTACTPTPATSCNNKFGSRVYNLTSAATGNDISAPLSAAMGVNSILGGKVYVVGSSAAGPVVRYTLPATTFNNIASAGNIATDTSGAGILIVNGDLEITGDLKYGSNGTITDLRQLASLMVIVKGDLYVNNGVKEAVGAYYVQGVVHTLSDITGQVKTNPLVINGLIIASRFSFDRQGAGTISNPSPSELIIYDGRIQSNAMPGLTDFSSALPNTSKVSP